jgi:penicillin amidase
LDGSSEKMILNIGFLNPSAVNPEWNFVYSANNQPEAVDGFYILVIIFQKTELKELPSY